MYRATHHSRVSQKRLSVATQSQIDILRTHWPSAIERLESRMLFNVGGTFSAPVNPEISTDISPAWRFALNPGGSPASTSFNDSSWACVSLPHTWDPNPTNLQYGDGWYRKTLTIPKSTVGDEIYLKFLGADLTATVYVDGVKVGSHNGGWDAFDVDVTSQMSAGSHLVAVDVNNNGDANLVPAKGGDYTKEGGLYRQVSLVGVNKAHVALTEPVVSPDTSGALVAGSGVYFSNSAVAMGISSTNIAVKTILDNSSNASAPLTVTSYLVDASGIIQAQQCASVTLCAGQTGVAVPQSAKVASPHLWNGLAGPYLYTLYVEVSNSTTGQLLDMNQQQAGIRTFGLNANTGFYLNGKSYKLVGFSMHQDSGAPGLNGGAAGWAQTDAEQQNDINMALGVGATMIRTAHYQRDPAFYSYCDQKGLIIETEIGINDNVTSTAAGSCFVNNAEDILTEMIRQNYNHPSIAFWSMYNEIRSDNIANATFIATLSALSHKLDATGRYTVGETCVGSTSPGSLNTASDALNFHLYDGWFGGNIGNIAKGLATIHAGLSTPLGMGEYGAAGSYYQFTDYTSSMAPTNCVYHPQNQLTTVVEAQWAAISSQTYLYDDLTWCIFDFTSYRLHQGDTDGINDMGVITRDRQNFKDLYYFYLANWNDPTSARGYNTKPVVWISDHQWTDRQGSASVPVTVFSNIGAPTLSLNGGSPIKMVQQVLNGMKIPDAYTVNLVLKGGSNNVQVCGTLNGKAYTNSVVWAYHGPALAGTPYAKVEFTNAANNVQAGYAADTGAAFSARGNGATYGWTGQNGSPAANTSGTYYRTANIAAPYNNRSAKTGIVLNPGNVWKYQLPNGTYDVHIIGADSATPCLVDNLLVNGTLLHATSVSKTGGTFQQFYTTVNVTNGLLTVSGGAGMSLFNGTCPITQGRLSAIEINAIKNTPPQPAGVALKTTASAYVQNGSYASTNFGTSSQLLVKQGPAPYERVSYISFSLASLTSTTVNSANLVLFGGLVGNDNPAFTINVLAVPNGSFSQNAITFNNAPATGVAIASATIPCQAQQTYTLILTPYIQQLVAAHATQATIAIVGTGATTQFASFNSDLASSNQPELVIG